MLDEKLFIYVQVEIIVFNDILVFREWKNDTCGMDINIIFDRVVV